MYAYIRRYLKWSENMFKLDASSFDEAFNNIFIDKSKFKEYNK
jgi:hypothetical protein